MARTPTILASILALAVAACGSQTSPPPPAATLIDAPAPALAATPPPVALTETATPSPVAIAAATTTDAPAAPVEPPSSLKLVKELVAVEPTGELPLLRDAETVVDPASTFRVVLSARIADARLLLLDADDAAVPAKETREVGTVTTLTLAPASPLRPGSRYALRLDGARTRDLHDEAGAAHAPFTLPVLAAGTPPPPEPPPKPAPKKRRSRR
jgi:hypothetical protein